MLAGEARTGALLADDHTGGTRWEMLALLASCCTMPFSCAMTMPSRERGQETGKSRRTLPDSCRQRFFDGNLYVRLAVREHQEPHDSEKNTVSGHMRHDNSTCMKIYGQAGKKNLKTANTTMAPAHPLRTRSHGGPRTETMTHFPEDMIMGLASMPFRPPHTTNDREWPKKQRQRPYDARCGDE